MSKTISSAADLFSPSDGIYLMSHSVGRMPLSALENAQRHFFDAWERGSPDPWELWLPSIDRFKQVLAELFSSSEQNFCPQTNISSALTKVLGALPKKPGKSIIVVSENDFPSTSFVLQQAQKSGFKLRWLPKSADLFDLATWDQGLTRDVHSVFVTHVHYNTNKRVPVKRICELARERNIISIVDVAQSAGVVPIGLNEWEVDVVIGSSVKWLCGGPGAAYLWIDSKLSDSLQPIDVGWFSHQKPFEFDVHHFEYADGAARFWGGTPSILPFEVASHSIGLINQIGVKNIASHNRGMGQRFIDKLEQKSFVSPLDPDFRGGTTVLKFDDMARAEKALAALNVQHDSRAYGIRLSPHIYNTQAEIDQVIDALIGC